MSDHGHGPSHGPSPKVSSNPASANFSMSEAIAGIVCVAIAAILIGVPIPF